jgi:low affinity Fe/Cu permease
MTVIGDSFGAFARFVNTFASSPAATALAFALVAIWAVSGPRFHYSDFWQLVMNTISSVITFLMVFVLNNAQSRDTAAINAKLDAIIFAMKDTDNRLIGLEGMAESQAKAVIDEMKATVEEAQD